MGQSDDGLTAIVAVVVFTLVAVGIPIGWAYVFTSEPPKAADWLGFAGSMLSAGVALVAARIAWRAVQRQIEVQREANMLGVLTREEDRLESDLHALDSCILLLNDVRRERNLDDPIAYYSRLKTAGLRVVNQDARDLVTTRAGTAVPRRTLFAVAGAITGLVGALENCIYMGRSTADDGTVVYAPSTSTWLKNADAKIDTVSTILIEEANATKDRLELYRRRIEAGLKFLP